MLYEGQVVDRTYQIASEIGAGGMGVVYLAYHLRLDKYVVLKKIKNATSDIEMLRNEVDILKSLHHTYLPQVYDFITFDGDVYTVIDYIEGYDLKSYIDNGIGITEGQLIKWFQQLCQVLVYIHSRVPKVLHMDIKPANIIVRPDGDICLIDFGISLYGDSSVKGISKDYASPEQYLNAYWIEQGFPEYAYHIATPDERTDIYSLGASFYHLITGIKPSCKEPLYPISPDTVPYISEPFIDIINRATCYEKEKRFSDASQMLKAIENMYKVTARYKLYFWMQIFSSVLAVVLIITGAAMIISDFDRQLIDDFNANYYSFVDAVNENDIGNAEQIAAKLLGSEYGDSIVDCNTKAKIYHGLGESYFEAEDYLNAAECYRKSCDNLTDSDKIEKYYCDYAITLICSNNTAKAQAVLDSLDRLIPNSSASYLIEAQLHFQLNQLDTAKEKLTSALQYADDVDIRFAAYMLFGDIYLRESHETEAEKSFVQALSCKENVSVLRKLGSVRLSIGNKTKSKVYYTAASDCFKNIYDKYTPTENDVINLAQAYLFMNDSSSAEKSIEILNSYTVRYGEKCRIYIMLALAANECSDSRVTDYCRKAHYLYACASKEERESIDKDSLESIRPLYRYYVKEAW